MDNEKKSNNTDINPEIEPNSVIEPNDSQQLNSAVDDIEKSEQQPIPSPKKGKLAFLKIDFKNMNRNTKLAIVLSVALVVVGIVTFMILSGNNTELASEENETVQEQEPVKTLGVAITLQEGTLQIQEDGQWKDVSADQEIGEGTELKTVGATSRAVITFDDGSAMRLDANSEVLLETITSERIVIKHVNGYTYNRVLASSNLKYVVTSTDAQYEALGTAFLTAATGDEESVEVFHSSVIETTTNKTAKEGEKLTVINKAKPTEEGSISKLDIEEVKSDPFLQWNRNLDEKDENYKSSLGFMSDVTAPEIKLDKNDGDVVLLEPSATEGTIEITGSTESGVKVTVLSKSQPGAATVDVTVGSDGKFTTPVLSAPVGDAVFEFTAKDRTGNKTTKTLRITFQRKSQPVAGNESGFVLTGVKKDSKVSLNWKLTGIEAPDGVKIVYGSSANPVFGESGVGSVYVETGNSGGINLADLKDGKNYIKACVYDKSTGTCGVYSTQITIEK